MGFFLYYIILCEGSDNGDDDEWMLIIDGVMMVMEDNDYGNIGCFSN